MVKGKIIKGIAGFYYVQTDDKIYECKARGKFRKDQLTPLVGDYVEIKTTNYDGSAKNDFLQGSIENILERTSKLIRPPVANVDQGLIVFSVSYPKLHVDLLDKFLIIMEKEKIDAHIILNKIDEKNTVDYKTLIRTYSSAGYNIVDISAIQNINLDKIRFLLRNKTSFFAGPSGVGKSTILNQVQQNLVLETGVVSEKIKRGKHTTRNVELMPLLEGGYVVDTPGFTSLQLDDIDCDDLKYYFREFTKYEGKCKFVGCNHINEPKCVIKQLLQDNRISKSRYESYVSYFDQLKNTKKIPSKIRS
ncbi:ribosome small subunit-dependent GTPase A [Candidatus Epulonipiscium fishelsonii]|uniref:Ribosome small subunit-dependent GTPase A n=1 Tax=Candidatus Epulonipiscium fishelsonii TaxID=77094 RepID=A0ACC8XDQ0_9FIRM|nr:ribosome small subunit-dependent GTPase A [Epulopiscium sp. SCG-B05WGA-EpuloA1]ONI41041.1 ribosome small subunit-dependent GTPase A [Epulopiscium sp. SCG-B11WGA-EpuloA1]